MIHGGGDHRWVTRRAAAAAADASGESAEFRVCTVTVGKKSPWNGEPSQPRLDLSVPANIGVSGLFVELAEF